MRKARRQNPLLWCALWVSVLSGCAPLASLRPASGIPSDHHAEVGVAAVRLSPRPYVEEQAAYTGQVWLSFEPSRHFGFSTVAAFDTNSAVGGVAARWNAIRTSRVALGPEAELGYAWGAGSLGLAVRPLGENWIYAAPRLGTLGFDWAFGIPVGVSVDLSHGFVLRAEAQLSWADFKYYNRRLHLASGIAYQW
jgi:hypothetical protein